MHLKNTIKENLFTPNRERYAIVSVANKLIGIIYYMLKRREPFNPSYGIKGDERNEGIDRSVRENVT